MNEQPQFSSAPGTSQVEPPQLFVQAVHGLADAINMDADALIQGQRFECNGIGFCLQHHGTADPDGATVLVDMGTIPEQEQLAYMRYMLQHNLSSCAALHGYYAVPMGTDIVLYCIRVDLARAQSAPAALATLIGTIVSSMGEAQHTLARAIEVMQEASDQQMADQPA